MSGAGKVMATPGRVGLAFLAEPRARLEVGHDRFQRIAAARQVARGRGCEPGQQAAQHADLIAELVGQRVSPRPSGCDDRQLHDPGAGGAAGVGQPFQRNELDVDAPVGQVRAGGFA